MTAIRPDVIDLPETVPARMVNEFVYCPRLFHLEWVQGRFATNDDVEEGLYVHRRVSTSRSVSFHARAECLANRAPLGPPSGYTGTAADGCSHDISEVRCDRSGPLGARRDWSADTRGQSADEAG
jgi:hypothetical protein